MQEKNEFGNPLVKIAKIAKIAAKKQLTGRGFLV
jgi:hypothetical protein